MSMRVKFWGVRGSLPSAPYPGEWVAEVEAILKSFFSEGCKSASDIRGFLAQRSVPQLGGFGCHTTCVEVSSKQSQFIIDGGTGLRNLGEQMMKGPCGKGEGEAHIFFTHFHWDHLLGVPFFAPTFLRGNKIHYYAVQPELEDIIRLKFRKPMFPVRFENLPATLSFHSLEPRKPFKMKDITITPYQLDHPDPCWGFRVESGGRVYSHCVDTEGTRTSREALGEDLPLYQKVDLMYFDAQYTLPELVDKANWGHSAAQIGIDLALRENVKNMLFAHHDPGANTEAIYHLKAQTREYFDWKVAELKASGKSVPNLKWRYAYDGLVVDLDDIKL